MSKKFLAFLLIICFLMPGCDYRANLFGILGLHEAGTSTDPLVLEADGEAAMAKGDYANAVIYYDAAIAAFKTMSYSSMSAAQQSSYEKALIGHANSLMMTNDIALTPILIEMLTSQSQPTFSINSLLPITDNPGAIASATSAIVDDFDTLMDINSKYAADAGMNLTAGVYKAMNVMADYLDNDFVEFSDDSETPDFIIKGSSESYPISYIVTMDTVTWNNFRSTLDIPTILAETQNAVTGLGTAMDYLLNCGDQIAPEMLDGIKSGYDEIQTQLENFTAKLLQ